jgi:hypothetical protein
MAGPDSFLNHRDEVGTRVDVVNVPESPAGKTSVESIINPAGVALSIVPPITNEDILG